MQPRVYLRDLHTRQPTQVPTNPLPTDGQHRAIDMETLPRRAPTNAIPRSIYWFDFQLHSLCLWLLRNLHPSTVRRCRREGQLAQLLEIVNSKRSGLHRLPVELVLDAVEYLEEDEKDALRRTCKWLESILVKRGKDDRRTGIKD